MTTLWAEQALTEQGWQRSVRIEINESGQIESMEADAAPQGHLAKIVLPAPANVHSHGFQRAVAGLTEHRNLDTNDNFWTWRALIYKFLDQLRPEDIESITAYAQMEMLESGFASVAEFHYVHHQPGGIPYQNIAELSERIIAAAKETGIGLTLLPVFYQYSGCGKQALKEEQLRFGNSQDDYLKLFEQASRAIAMLPSDSRIGAAVHSLRAVDPEGMKFATSIAPQSAFHIHVAEQIKEVQEFESYYGVRPVEWLLENADLDGRWCLIHATHMTNHETIRLSKCGTVTGLCPITEANLGDGIFNGVLYAREGGKYGIGTDSNIRVSLCEELRMLEYSQRLRDQTRAVLAKPGTSSGRTLFDGITKGGAQALMRESGSLKPNNYADFLVLDADSFDLAGRVHDDILDCFIFAGDNCMVSEVWSAGRQLVTEGRHVRRPEIAQRYLETKNRIDVSL